MKEIIVLHIGSTGRKIGELFWQEICEDHGINPNSEIEENDGNSKPNIYFNEISQNNHYVPRAIFLDLDQVSVNDLTETNMRKIWNPNGFVCSISGAGNNFAKGYCTEGPEILENSMEVIRKEVEKCESFQGFQIFHSVGGGTGSGFGSLLLNELKQEYCNNIIFNFTSWIDWSIGDVVVEPYNVTLSLPYLIQNSDGVLFFENRKILEIAYKINKRYDSTRKELNRYISSFACNFTSSFRFSGETNFGMRRLLTTLVPFKKSKFFIGNFGPLIKNPKISVNELIENSFDGKNLYVDVDSTQGKYFASFLTFRGNVPIIEVDEKISNLKDKNNYEFIDWIPNNIITSFYTKKQRDLLMSISNISNTSIIKTIFQKVSYAFTRMCERRAFQHWYISEGLENIEFDQAGCALKDLISEIEMNENGLTQTLEDDFDEEIELEIENENLNGNLNENQNQNLNENLNENLNQNLNENLNQNQNQN
ncbi:tubulin beta chain-related [Anaeramoeba ignava]|uniref:Tubulin beta chain n=1 Tax=Anaeramoeba ignava TaxID=1746090 RepID=A0A9Q0R7C6_ANAIG|nr:tubulin beta chain-related [Anaeramoeba ignava]